jgi:putative peptidoglycan lipid II flippase
MVRGYFARFANWQKRSIHRSILNAIFTIGGLSLISKLLYAGKDVLVAREFGLNSQLDAYLTALVLITFVINLTAGAFDAAFIPTYIETRQADGLKAAQALFSAVLGRITIVLLGASAALLAVSPLVLRFFAVGFSPEILGLSQQFLLLMTPTLLVTGLSTILGAVLNANEHFTMVALSPMASPIAVVVFLLIAVHDWGIYTLVAGAVAGSLIQLGILIWELGRHRLLAKPSWGGDSAAVHQILLQYLPMVAGAFIMSGTEVVDKAMATPLGPGSVSALSYGYKLVAIILNVGAAALGTALFPPFSRLIAAKDWAGAWRMLRQYSVLILIVTLPLTVGLIYFSEPLVRLIFERGAFTAQDTQLVSHVQSFYFLQIPFYMLSIAVVRVLSSLRKNHVLMAIAVVNLFMDIILNQVFIRQFGLAGIALSTSVVYLISFILIVTALRYYGRQLSKL